MPRKTTRTIEAPRASGTGSLRFGEHDSIRAVLFDVDGTLYHQEPLRWRMAIELLGVPFAKRSIRRARRTWAIVASFRRVREKLRVPPGGDVSLEKTQYLATANHLGVPVDEVRNVTREWIFQRPLRHLGGCVRDDLRDFLDYLRARAVKIGVFSDYAAKEKLVALGVDEYVSLTLAATDPEINAFKPSPDGFLCACSAFRLPPQEVLYVGDRPDVDATGAKRVGMPCAIITRKSPRSDPSTTTSFKTFHSLSGLRYELDADQDRAN